jgi:hypothetical protein
MKRVGMLTKQNSLVTFMIAVVVKYNHHHYELAFDILVLG